MRIWYIIRGHVRRSAVALGVLAGLQSATLANPLCDEGMPEVRQALQLTRLDDHSAGRAEDALARFEEARRRGDVDACRHYRQLLRELLHLDH